MVSDCDCDHRGEPGVVEEKKAAGGLLTAKQATHRPGTAPALGLRAGGNLTCIISQTACFMEYLS